MLSQLLSIFGSLLDPIIIILSRKSKWWNVNLVLNWDLLLRVCVDMHREDCAPPLTVKCPSQTIRVSLNLWAILFSAFSNSPATNWRLFSFICDKIPSISYCSLVFLLYKEKTFVFSFLKRACTHLYFYSI